MSLSETLQRIIHPNGYGRDQIKEGLNRSLGRTGQTIEDAAQAQIDEAMAHSSAAAMPNHHETSGLNTEQPHTSIGTYITQKVKEHPIATAVAGIGLAAVSSSVALHFMPNGKTTPEEVFSSNQAPQSDIFHRPDLNSQLSSLSNGQSSNSTNLSTNDQTTKSQIQASEYIEPLVGVRPELDDLAREEGKTASVEQNSGPNAEGTTVGTQTQDQSDVSIDHGSEVQTAQDTYPATTNIPSVQTNGSAPTPIQSSGGDKASVTPAQTVEPSKPMTTEERIRQNKPIKTYVDEKGEEVKVFEEHAKKKGDKVVYISQVVLRPDGKIYFRTWDDGVWLPDFLADNAIQLFVKEVKPDSGN